MLRLAWLFLLISTSCLVAQDVGAEKHPFDIGKEKLDQLVAADQKQHAGNADVLVNGAIIANKKTQTVTIRAMSTSVNENDPVEFWLTPAESGKEYESLAVAFVKPSDVHKALEYIGLKAGQPVNYDKNRFWTRGPRVMVQYTLNVNGKEETVRAEQLMLDVNTNQPLTKRTFMFTGSFQMPGDDKDKAPKYAADFVDTRPILPNYNDPAAVLDTPMRAMQSAVYGSLRINPKYAQKMGSMITITISPAPADEQTVEKTIVVSASADDGQIKYAIADDKGAAQSTHDTLAALTVKLAELAGAKTDLFASIIVDDRMRVTDVRKLYTVLQSLESDNGLRLDPVAEQVSLFYRAFFPDEQWRKREDRLGEPFELHLTRVNGVVQGKLERMIDNPDQTGIQPTLLQTFDAATPEMCQKALTDHASQWSRVIFVFPPSDLTYKELCSYVLPNLEQYPRIFVFAPAGDPTTQPAATQPEK